MEEEFKRLYVNTFTTTFADDLEALRNNEQYPEKVSLQLLAENIKLGIGTYSTLEKELFVKSVPKID